MLFDHCFQLPEEQVPKTVVTEIPPAEKQVLRKEIKQLLIKQNARIVAHYYTHPDIQILAGEMGGYVSDSLEMARFGYRSDATTLVVCGVRFMGETAKILSPEKRILIPDIDANCSLDIGCPADKFSHFCDAYPNHVVVVYANTSAAVKARADWVVTSSSATYVVRHLAEQGREIIWAPDKYLGEYVQAQTGANMLLWKGSCVVHEEFKADALRALRRQHPFAKVLVHPESSPEITAQADFVGSTTGIIKAAQQMQADSFIIATDQGLLYKLKELMPNKTFLVAPTAGEGATCKSCAHCPWMAMNDLYKLRNVLLYGHNEIHIDPEIRVEAYQAIERLLKFTQRQQIPVAGDA